MLVGLTMAAVALCIGNFDNRLEKLPVNLNDPPFSFQGGSIDDQLRVVPRILDFLVDFTSDQGMRNPEIAVNYLESLAVPPYQMVTMKELVAKLIRLSLSTHITRTEPLEAEILVRVPDVVGTVFVAEFYAALQDTLERLSSTPSDGEIAYLMVALAGEIKIYTLIEQQLKPYKT